MIPMSENDLLGLVVDRATRLGYHVHHTRPARTAGNEWRTPIQGHIGFPDLVLAQAGQVFAWELKSARGQLREEQAQWGQELGAGVPSPLWWEVVKPANVDDALERLKAAALGRRSSIR